MLHRRCNHGTILISQPAHAWVSGQIGAAWADAFEPHAEILLATEQHDVGWNDWEQRTSFNTTTGLPHAFLEMGTADHLAIWTNAGQRIEPMSALAALLVSRHGTGLYERFHTFEQVKREPQVKAYLEREKATQRRLIERLRHGRGWGDLLSDEALERATRLIAAWDWLSLIVCMNESERGEVKDVPWGNEAIDLQIVREEDDRWGVSPWPLAGRELTLVAEGHIMAKPAASEAEMRAMLAEAEMVRVEIVLARD